MTNWLRIQMKYNRATNLPADVQVNTIYVSGVGATAAADAAAASTPIANFIHTVDNFLTSNLFAATADVVYYDMSDPEPRIPIRTDSVALTLGTSQGLPEEVSMCLSFKGVQASGVNMAHRRGRIFLPTFTTAQIGASASNTIWLASVVGSMGTAASTLQSQLQAASLQWQVFSPTLFASTGSLTSSMSPVTSGWIDNSPDTQRRRGHAPSTRTLWV